ncbi:hypothetical protein GCM10017673_05490 [Streptosporangium violaceochromogenes]|nr:hypothetical protein GCM10017673_05490 [Streptosporangium violaceochromogenes]
MTESDPGLSGEEIPDAGMVGARRQEVGEPISPGERLSLNLPPKELDTPPAGARPGAPPSGGRQETRGGEEGSGAPGERRPAESGVTAGGGGVEAVRRDIQEDRRRLGDTVEALMRKTDVKGRAGRRAARMGGELRRMGADTAGAAAEAAGRLGGMAPAGIRDAVGRVTAGAAGRPVVIVAAAAVLTLVAMRALGRRRGSGRGRASGGCARLRLVGGRAGRHGAGTVPVRRGASGRARLRKAGVV